MATSPTSTSSSSQDPPIDFFPTEVLLLIFIEAYLNSRHKFRSNHDGCLRAHKFLGPGPGYTPCDCSDEDKVCSSEWWNADLVNPLLFPYPIAAVCQRWRNIMESAPVFWTRIVAFVDTRPTPPTRILKQLQLSESLELDIFILRQPDTYTHDDAGEHERCRAAIDLLTPHLHRCRTMSFDVINTSSLPSISRDFHGPALALTELMLKARVDDGRVSGDRSSVSLPPNNQPFHCPNLSKIDIDGRNFAYACLDSPSWQASLNDASLARNISIKLSNFIPTLTKDHQFTLDDFLGFIGEVPDLHTLVLDNIEFNYFDFEPPAINDRVELYASSFSAIDLATGFMNVLLWGIIFNMLEFMHIERCWLSGAIIAPYSSSLSLKDIDVEQSLERFLDHWPGYTLDVVRCPGFDDAALSKAFDPDLDKILCLTIEDCEAFSARGLRTMVKAMMCEEGCTVSNLKVSGWGPPPPSEKEMKWLNKHVESFSWEANEREYSDSD